MTLEGSTPGGPEAAAGWLQQSEQARLFLDISRAMTSTLNLEELYGLALDRLRDLIPFAGAVVAVRSEGKWKLAAARRPQEIGEGDVAPRLRGWDRSEWTKTVLSGTGFYVDDIRGDDPRAVEYRSYLSAPIEESPMRYFRSILEVPLMLKSEVVGEISVSHAEPGYFNDAHLDLVTAVGSYLVIAMENARLFRKAEDRANALAVLLDLSRSVSSTLDLDELYRVALDRLRDLLPYAGATISLNTPRGPRMVAARRPTPISEGRIARRPGWHQTNFMQSLAAGRAIVIQDIRGDDPFAVEYRDHLTVPIEESQARYFRSVLAVPLKVGDRVIGDLGVVHERPDFFTVEHEDLVMSVANHVAIGIENARLFADARARRDELAALLDLSTEVTSTLNLSEVPEKVLDRIHRLIPYTGASIGLNIPEGVRRTVLRRPEAVAGEDVPRRPGWLASEFMTRLYNGEWIRIQDLLSDEPMAVDYRAYLETPIDETGMRTYRSLMTVPLTSRGRVVGDLSLAHSEPNFFSDEHVEILLSVANHIAIAIDNGRLYDEARERTRELSSLLEVSRSVAGSLDTESLARVVLDQLRHVMDYGNASLVLREGPLLRIAYANTHDDPSPRREVTGVTFEIANAGPIWETLQRGEALLVDDNRDGGYWSLAYQQVVGDLYDTAFAGVRSWMGVPLRVRDETIGFLTVSAPEPAQFRQPQVDLAMAFAAQVSVAFENAELLRQAQSSAATEERQRLARELHDSVSQALYGIALGARTARTQLDRDPAAAKEPMDYVLSLAEAGLAEMRALIFELRPESLANEGIIAALEKQVAATRARYGLQIECDFDDEPDLPVATKEALYRVAQEALHNVVKHAGASLVKVTLRGEGESTTLGIADDGRGFDADRQFPGHLGLQSMRERAAAIEGTLEVVSEAGHGTAVRLKLANRNGR